MPAAEVDNDYSRFTQVGNSAGTSRDITGAWASVTGYQSGICIKLMQTFELIQIRCILLDFFINIMISSGQMILFSL